MDLPTFEDVVRAQRVIDVHLPPTPMWSYPSLDAAVGARVYVKQENTQPTGAFKVRGGLTLLASMSDDDLRAGIVSYSTGNHAQSLAYASQLRGVRCRVVMPISTPVGKRRAVTGYGAEVVLHGEDMTEAQEHAEALSAAGGRLVSPGDEPKIVAGVGSLYVEVLRARADLDAVVVPVGSGTGAAAACLVAQAIAPRCRVIGVQSASAPAAHDSWQAGTLERRPIGTRVEGLATGRGFALPQALMRGRLADFVLVEDEDIDEARRLLAVHAHVLAEGAGATALAGVLASPALQGATLAVIVTGGNANERELATLTALSAPGPAPLVAGT